ncbi:MAG: hypothetical protein ACI3WR_02520 [Oscillospiraceae bacterium]
MAKTKKKNSNYGGWQPPKQEPEKQEPSRYGIPGWAVAVCFAVLVAALVLYTQGSGMGWSVVGTYFLTGIPALVLAAGQRRVKQETGSKTAAVLMWLLAVIGTLYLVSGITGAVNLLNA